MDELLEALLSKLMDKGVLTAGDLGEIRADAMMRREEAKARRMTPKQQRAFVKALDNTDKYKTEKSKLDKFVDSKFTTEGRKL